MFNKGGDIMLQITTSYSDELNREISRFVCANVAKLIRIKMDIIDDCPDYDFRWLLPESYVDGHSREECYKVLKTVYDRIRSSVIYEEFIPLQQYALCEMIEEAIEYYEDVPEAADQVNYVLPEWIHDKLKEECDEDLVDYVIDSLTDLHNYVSLFFEDFDFDEESIRGIVYKAMHYPEDFLSLMDYDDLERYVDVMPSDVAEEYAEFKTSAHYPAVLAFQKLKETGTLDFIEHSASNEKSSWDVTLLVLENFRYWVENAKGWEWISTVQTNKTEKAVQKLIQLCGQYICEQHNVDMSFEPNEGPGPVDIKISRGNDKTIVEVKLSSNGQYMHGFTTQIEQYAKAEKCSQRIYVYIKNEEHADRVEAIQNKYDEEMSKGSNPPLLYVVDALPKKSASRM